jgi:hypothetical protein
MVNWLSPNKDRQLYDSALQVFYANTFMNSTFTFLTGVLILFMWKKGALKMNIYAKCVLLLTTYQFMYEICSPIIVVACAPTSPTNSMCTGFIAFGIVFGGVGATTWSFIIALFALFTVEFQRRPTEKEEFWTIVVTNAVLLAYAIPYIVVGHQAHTDLKTWGLWMQVYGNVRLALIALSVVAIGRLYILYRRLTVAGRRQGSPLWHLLRRLFLYPIVQGLARLGGSMYTFVYGQLINNYPEQEDNVPPLQTFLLFCVVVLMPLAGIGGFVVFLQMQSGAKYYLGKLLCLESLQLCQEAPPAERNTVVSKLPGGLTDPSTYEAARVNSGRTESAAKRSSGVNQGVPVPAPLSASAASNTDRVSPAGSIESSVSNQSGTRMGSQLQLAVSADGQLGAALDRVRQHLSYMDEGDLADAVVAEAQMHTQRQTHRQGHEHGATTGNIEIAQKSRTMADMHIEGGGGSGGGGEEEREGSIVGIEFNPLVIR